MSRIYDAIQSARESRSRNGLDNADFLGEMALAERRVDPRKELGIDLTVYGRSADGAAFYEQAKAIRGNANGGVLLLSNPVVTGQNLMLINNGTSQEQICSIAGVRVDKVDTLEVMVSFPVSNQDFWKPTGAARNS